MISDRVQILMPYHVDFDTYEEARLANKQFGSTKSGIVRSIQTNTQKTGIQICDLFYPEILRERIENACTIKMFFWKISITCLNLIPKKFIMKL